MRVILQADQRQNQKHRNDFASSSTRTIPIRERIWIDVEPGKQSVSDCSVSKKLIHLLRHGSLHREDNGAIIKDNLQSHFVQPQHWYDEMWKKSMAGGGGHKKRFQ